MRPIIGIATSLGLSKDGKPENDRFYANRLYGDCLVEAGATPLLIPRISDPAEIVQIIDGLLIPGGDDIDASHFGEQNHPAITLEDPERFPFESKLLDLISPKAPVLGICYGCQAINVHQGGNIIQHIPDVTGDENHSGGTMQEYTLEPCSQLAAIVGSCLVSGKSYHHQSNDRIGTGLKVVGKSDDGIIEAIENEGDRWMIGVQWHPERTPDSAATKALFKSFVEAAKTYKESRS